MTLVRMSFAVPNAAGTPSPASGSLRFTPTARRILTGSPDTVILPASFTVELVNGSADVTLEPTTGAWVWKVDEHLTGATARTIHVTVPDAVEVDYTDLVSVDPATLEPTAAPEAAWVAMAASTITTGTVTGDDLILTRTDGTTVNAGNVRGADGADGTDATVTPEIVAANLPARLSDASLQATYASGFVHFIVSDTQPTETTVDGKPVVWIDTSTAPAPDTTAPSAVANLAAGSPTTTTIPLSWTAATDAVGVTGYEYSLNGATWTSTGSTGTTYTVTGLTAGTAYTVQVRAFDAAGNKGAAASVSATTTASSDTTAPTAPTNLAGTAGETTMALSWTASTDAVGVTGYRVSKDNGATWITSSVTGTTYQVTGLTAGTSYTFAVAARDAAGNWSTNATLTKSTSAAPPTVAYSEEVLADAPSQYWRMNDSVGATSVNDTGSLNSESGFTQTLTDLTLGAQGIGDGATSIQFNGTSSKGQLAASVLQNTLYSVTIEAIVKPTANGSLKHVVGASNNGITLIIDNGKPQFRYNSSNLAASTESLTLDTIYHLAGVMTSTELKLYVNGVLKATLTGTFGYGTANYHSLSNVGQNGNGYYAGYMAGAAVYYHKALTAERVLAHAQAAGL